MNNFYLGRDNINDIQQIIFDNPASFTYYCGDWDYLAKSCYLPDSFIEYYFHKFNIKTLIYESKLSLRIIEKILPILTKDLYNPLLSNQILSEFLIEKIIDKMNKDDIDWIGILYLQDLSEKFIEKHIMNDFDLLNDKSVITYLCSRQKLSKKFIEKYRFFLNLDALMRNKLINKEDIEDLITLKEII